MPRRCWARSIGDCSEKLSGEHLVSKALFSESVTVRGFDWCKDRPKTIGINSLAAKVLCVRHNSALSELDAAALKVWNALKELADVQEGIALAARLRIPVGPPRPLRLRVSGSRLERWAFKTTVNHVAAGARDAFPDGWEPPPDLVRFIFGREALREGCGLGIVCKLGERVDDWDRISLDLIRSLSRESPGLEGFLMAFRGLRLAGSSTVPLRSLHTPVDFVNPEQVLLQPQQLAFRPLGELNFTWQ